MEKLETSKILTLKDLKTHEGEHIINETKKYQGKLKYYGEVPYTKPGLGNRRGEKVESGEDIIIGGVRYHVE